MGRRSRKRITGAPSPSGSPSGPAPAPPRTPRARATLEEAPKPPWAPFPLVELVIFAGLVLLVIGIFSHGPRANVLLACGVVLSALGGLEVSVREHISGYRSHTTLLAFVGAVALAGLLFFLVELPLAVTASLAILAFAGLFWLLRGMFRRRSGGLGFRV